MWMNQLNQCSSDAIWYLMQYLIFSIYTLQISEDIELQFNWMREIA